MRISLVCAAVLALGTPLPSALAQTPNQVIGAGFPIYSPGVPSVAPGEVLALVTTALNVPDAVATQTPVPTSLSGVAVLARVVGAVNTAGYPTSLPILRIYSLNASQMITTGSPCPTQPNVVCSNTKIVVEIPTEGVCAPRENGSPEACTTPPFIDLPPLLILNVTANGTVGPDMPLQVVARFPHILNSCDPVFGPPSVGCHSVVTHGDGSPVTETDDGAAQVGETITLYAVGLGFDGILGRVPTGTAPKLPVAMFGGAATSIAAVAFTYDYPLPGGSSETVYATSQSVMNPVWSGLVPGYVGLYQANVRVPPAPSGSYPACGSYGNTTLSFLGLTSGTLPTAICVHPQIRL